MKVILFLLLAPTVSGPPLDPARVAFETAADADVLRSLRQNGDDPAIRRPVDVRFVGQRKSIAKLKKEIAALGWIVVQQVAYDDGEVALDVQREQSTDQAAIRALREAALRIEGIYGVRYDGWGTVATKQ